MARSIESESENEQSPQHWSFYCRSAKNHDLATEIEGLQFSEPFSIPVAFNKTPDHYLQQLQGEQLNAEPINAHVTARWLLPCVQAKENIAEKPDELALCFHGFGCAHIEDHNYFSALIACMGIPALSVDLPGFNATKADAKLFAKHGWMDDIAQYPYMMAQVIEHMAGLLPNSAVEPSNKQLNLHIIAHSVAARSLLVAASLNGGTLLRSIEDTLTQKLGRIVHFKLTALEPAFSLQSDFAITAAGVLDLRRMQWILGYMPSLGLITIQMLLSCLTGPYGLPNVPWYPLSSILIRENLGKLLAHPNQIKQRPAKTVLRWEQLREQYNIVVVMAANDSLVDNGMTTSILSNEATHNPFEFADTHVALTSEGSNTAVTCTQLPGSSQRKTGIIIVEGGHVLELQHPEVIRALITNGHAHQPEILKAAAVL